MILLEEIHNLYLYCDMLKFNNLLGEQSYFLCVWLWPISLYFWRDLSFNVHYAVAKSFLPEQKEILTLRSKWSWYWILNNKSNQIKKVFLFCWNIFFFWIQVHASFWTKWLIVFLMDNLLCFLMSIHS